MQGGTMKTKDKTIQEIDQANKEAVEKMMFTIHKKEDTMRHVILTCKNHPELRWSCKEIAFSDDLGYNGMRNIFFDGIPDETGMYADGSGLSCTTVKDGKIIKECTCPSEDLIRAPEDALVKK